MPTIERTATAAGSTARSRSSRRTSGSASGRRAATAAAMQSSTASACQPRLSQLSSPYEWIMKA
jgi:hypothetical protein